MLILFPNDNFYFLIEDRLDFDTLSMWLANVWRLLQLCRQYSGEEVKFFYRYTFIDDNFSVGRT